MENILISIQQNDLFTWVILPLLIFFARIMDVSIGTMRLIFVSKGFKYLAPILGFFEVLIWLLAIGQIMQHLDNFMSYISYGLGFATGNYIGILLEEKMSIGTVVVRIIPKRDSSLLITELRKANYGVSTVDIEGMTGKTKMIFSIIKRKDLPEVIQMVNLFNPNAFFTVEEIKAVKEGFFRATGRSNPFDHLNLLRRKGK